MEKGSEQLLKAIVELHIADARPIGSAALAETFEVSPATIRNDMVLAPTHHYHILNSFSLRVILNNFNRY